MNHTSGLIHYAVAAASDAELAALAEVIPMMSSDTFTAYAHRCRHAGVEEALLKQLVAAPQASPSLRVSWAHRYATDVESAAVMLSNVRASALAYGYRKLLGRHLDRAREHVVEAIVALCEHSAVAQQAFQHFCGVDYSDGAVLVPFPERCVDLAALGAIKVSSGHKWARTDLALLGVVCRAADPATAASLLASFEFPTEVKDGYPLVDLGAAFEVLCTAVLPSVTATNPEPFLACAEGLAMVAPWEFYSRLDAISERFEEHLGLRCPLRDATSEPTANNAQWATVSEVFEACVSDNPPSFVEITAAVNTGPAFGYAMYLLGANPKWQPTRFPNTQATSANRIGFLTRRNVEADVVVAAMNLYSDDVPLRSLIATAEDPVEAVACYVAASTPSFTYQRLERLLAAGLLTDEVVATLDAAVLHSVDTAMMSSEVSQVIGRWLLANVNLNDLALVASFAGDVPLGEVTHLVAAAAS